MSTLSRHLVWLRLTGSTQVRLHSLSQTRDKSKCWPLLPRGHKEPKHIEATEAETITLRAGKEKPPPPASGRPEGGGRGRRSGV